MQAVNNKYLGRFFVAVKFCPMKLLCEFAPRIDNNVIKISSKRLQEFFLRILLALIFILY